MPTLEPNDHNLDNIEVASETSEVYLPLICGGVDDPNCDAFDGNEPNNSSDEATQIGFLNNTTITQYAPIAPAYDEDWYSFIASEEDSGIVGNDIDVYIGFNINPGDKFLIRVFKWEVSVWTLVCGPVEEYPQYPDNSNCSNGGESYSESIIDNIALDDTTTYQVLVYANPSFGATCDDYQIEINVED